MFYFHDLLPAPPWFSECLHISLCFSSFMLDINRWLSNPQLPLLFRLFSVVYARHFLKWLDSPRLSVIFKSGGDCWASDWKLCACGRGFINAASAHWVIWLGCFLGKLPGDCQHLFGSSSWVVRIFGENLLTRVKALLSSFWILRGRMGSGSSSNMHMIPSSCFQGAVTLFFSCACVARFRDLSFIVSWE